MLKEVETEITRLTNQYIQQCQNGIWGSLAKEEASGTGYSDIWNRAFSRVTIQKWDGFIREYPEKAQAYRGEIEDVGRAFKREEK
ncbi:MAG: hypothetical protein EXS52_00040 [Candidatus Staskawiczbacteria bacterium]|nr:hypothetical protein [Candidatus Staskawiczbacteria bacterium]